MKYQNIIDNMTLKEKAAFLSGKSEWQTRDFPRLDIPAIFCSDGPNGVRKQAGAGDQSSSTGNLFSYSGSYGKQLG